jgi:adenylosuccinate synthase
MPVRAVVGAQWGDEGKGRIVDYMAQKADVVIRFQGGDNAGHTVVNNYGKFALHILPSGIFNPDTLNIVGTGTVVNPDQLEKELGQLEAAGVNTSNLIVSDRAHVVMPYHPSLDGLEESSRAEGKKIGTTKRGIGPTYADKAARWGLRMGDLLRPDHLRTRLEDVLPRKNRTLREFGVAPVDIDELMAQAEHWRNAIGHRIRDVLPEIRSAVRTDQDVLLEGQLGVMRDLDWGIYPYVTSSNPTAAAAAMGAGIPAACITDVVGVVKVYSTAVGGGPFPPEDLTALGNRLRDVGQEYGATTGRPRRCGWFDAVSIRHAAWLNGFTALAVTKVDILDGFEEIPLCRGYRLDGQEIVDLPYTTDLDRVEPVWEKHEGWMASTRDARHWNELPEKARNYISHISTLAETPIRFVSVGPERDQLITCTPDR